MVEPRRPRSFRERHYDGSECRGRLLELVRHGPPCGRWNGVPIRSRLILRIGTGLGKCVGVHRGLLRRGSSLKPFAAGDLRFVRTIRAECLDWLLILGQGLQQSEGFQNAGSVHAAARQYSWMSPPSWSQRLISPVVSELAALAGGAERVLEVPAAEAQRRRLPVARGSVCGSRRCLHCTSTSAISLH